MAPTPPNHPAHNAALEKIAARVRHFHARKTPFRVYHGTANSTRKSPYRHDNTVDISGLNHILDIHSSSSSKRESASHGEPLVFVEPNVPMDQLVDETLKHGLLPPVVMDFPGITCGGGFAGTSGESSSFRHGLFDRTVKFVEMVLGNGDVVVASEDSCPDLFRGAASSFGTLGVVTMLGIALVPAKRFVSLTYVRISGMEEGLELVRREQEDEKLDYIDGIFFAKDRGVLCLGKLTDTMAAGTEEVKQFLRPQDDWFYMNAEKLVARRSRWTETIPIKDYLFRYDRGAFWMGKYTYQYFAVPFNWFTRWALSKWTHTRVMYHALHQSGLADKYIVQDVAVPYQHAARFLEYLDDEFRNYPIWICPLKLGGREDGTTYGGLLGGGGGAPTAKDDAENMVLNFGVWGPGPGKQSDFIAWNQAFEDQVQALRGRKWLYAHTYYTEEKFGQIYDKEKYDALRRKYHAEYLPNLYLKVRVDVKKPEQEAQGWLLWVLALIWSVWPIAGLYGWVSCLVSREYLMPKRMSWIVREGGKARVKKEVALKGS
ncbi:Delta(24)-sterol reductase [Lecanosticta acicola]|uniref:Delta(24)-sterol reductase n=1 Tax=Lecanosticta acicola TaxID=111012 RepID=A0AAI8Z821_9PEZI|nr:Delta(24)-sterol reductase [Lecanosticta acicola]